jgi:hypothetical protein
MQHAEEANLCAEMLRIACHFEKGFGTGAEQQTVEDLLVLQHQWSQPAAYRCRGLSGESIQRVVLQWRRASSAGCGGRKCRRPEWKHVWRNVLHLLATERKLWARRFCAGRHIWHRQRGRGFLFRRPYRWESCLRGELQVRESLSRHKLPSDPTKFMKRMVCYSCYFFRVLSMSIGETGGHC